MSRLHGHDRLVPPVAALLLAIHAGLLAWAAWRHSPTFDEPGHLVAGMRSWDTGRYDLYRVNPPLVRMLAAAPVILARPLTNWRALNDFSDPRREFQVGRDFVEANRDRAFFLFALARWACIPLSLLGGAACYQWGREMYGPCAGLVALTLWCSCPSIIGHAHLVAADAGAAALGVSAGYVFWRWAKHPRWESAGAAGLVFGLAELTKATWLVLFPLWPALWALGAWRNRHQTGLREVLSQIGQLAGILAVAVFTVNAGYGFEGSFRPLGRFDFVSQALATSVRDKEGFALGNRFHNTWLGEIPVPFPENYVLGIDQQKLDFEQAGWAYLRGEWRQGGWWYYYLYALAIKVPLGTSTLLLLAACLTFGHRARSVSRYGDLFLMAPAAAVLALVSSQSGSVLYVRYVLPILPFAFIWAGKTAHSMHLGNRWIAAIVAGALTWSVSSSLYVYPHSLSYFNESVGGPKGGHAHLLDSNIDWGQDLLYLKAWLDQHPDARPLRLAYWGSYGASLAGMDEPLPPRGPQCTIAPPTTPHQTGPLPGWYALSVNEIRRHTRDYDYFLRFRPVAMAGYSIYIYHVTPQEANRVRRTLALPEVAEAPVDSSGCIRLPSR